MLAESELIDWFSSQMATNRLDFLMRKFEFEISKVNLSKYSEPSEKIRRTDRIKL